MAGFRRLAALSVATALVAATVLAYLRWDDGASSGPAAAPSPQATTRATPGATDEPDAPQTGLRDGALPVVLYNRSGFLSPHAGFPDLIVYSDGTVLRAKPGSAGGPGTEATRLTIPPGKVQELLAALSGSGLFDVDAFMYSGSGYDLEGVYIEAVDGSRRVAAFLYGERRDLPGAAAVQRAADQLDTFAATLAGGTPYVPAGFLLEFEAVGTVSDPPSSPFDASQARDWSLPEIELEVLAETYRTSITLPPSYRAKLEAITPGYTPGLVKTGREGYFRVRWRPLYWNE